MRHAQVLAALAIGMLVGCSDSNRSPVPRSNASEIRCNVASPTDPDGTIPAAPPFAGTGDREVFGAAVVRDVSSVLLGGSVQVAVERLQAAGWTVTVGERTASPTTATPDVRWDRLVIWSCDGLVAEITFD